MHTALAAVHPQNMMNAVVNRLPSPTWRWLGMNVSGAEIAATPGTFVSEPALPEGVSVSALSIPVTGVATGMGPAVDQLLESAHAPVWQIEASEGTCPDAPVRITREPEAGEAFGLFLRLAPGSRLSVVLWLDASRLPPGEAAAVSIRYALGEGAALSLTQVLIGSEGQMLSDIGGDSEASASFDLHQVVLGGRQTFLGCAARLSGKKSSMTLDLGYFLSGSESLDTNYLTEHTGEKTSCRMDAAGVLCDEASKLFRGTIDFKRGAKAAKGSEMEEVLLMDERVVCRTIPVILCAEEDVEGDHGASIGRLDEEMLFYMLSRGMDEASVYEMMARARIDAVAGRIPDEETRKRLTDWLASHPLLENR